MQETLTFGYVLSRWGRPSVQEQRALLVPVTDSVIFERSDSPTNCAQRDFVLRSWLLENLRQGDTLKVARLDCLTVGDRDIEVVMAVARQRGVLLGSLDGVLPNSDIPSVMDTARNAVAGHEGENWRHGKGRSISLSKEDSVVAFQRWLTDPTPIEDLARELSVDAQTMKNHFGRRYPRGLSFVTRKAPIVRPRHFASNSVRLFG